MNKLHKGIYWGLAIGAVLYLTIWMIWSRGVGAVPPAQEMQIAEAYHCGMLDAMQVKLKRGRACDDYKAIAKKKGVEVPP